MIIKRKEAVAAGLVRYFTGKPCVNGHISERNTKSKSCMACRNAEQARWRDANRERCRALARKGSRKYRIANSEKWAEVYRSWRALNADAARASTRSWREANKDAYAAYQAARRARIRATAAMLTPEERSRIREVYRACAEASARTGVKHHVDHIVPLALGGANHPSNLQLLTAIENQKKGART